MEKLKKIAKLEYAFMAYNLVFVLYMLVAIPVEVIVSGKYSLVVFAGSLLVSVLAGYACFKAKRGLNRLHLLAILFYLWVLASIAYRATDASLDNIPHMLLLFCLVVPSFLSFLSYTKAQYITQWKVLAVGYNSAVTALCVAGIWCTFADLYLSFPAVGYNYIAFIDLKLYILTHYNGVGHYIAFAMLLAIFMVIAAKKTVTRILFALDFAVLYFTLALTYSRTVELTVAACMAVALCYFIWHSPKVPVKGSAVQNVLLRLVICGVVSLAVIAAGYTSMVAINSQSQAYITAMRAEHGTSRVKIEVISTQGTVAKPAQSQHAVISAQAISTATSVQKTQVKPQPSATVMQPVSQGKQWADSAAAGMTDEEYLEYLQDARSLSDLSTLATRFYYWGAALQYFTQNTSYQVIGTSPVGVVGLMAAALPDAKPPHSHNVFVQVLLATGYVGFLLFVLFWGASLFGACKLFFKGQHGFVGDCLPLLLILAFTAMGLQENMLFSSETSLMLPAFFMGCASVACLSQTKTN